MSPVTRQPNPQDGASFFMEIISQWAGFCRHGCKAMQQDAANGSTRQEIPLPVWYHGMIHPVPPAGIELLKIATEQHIIIMI